jgi:hypothetical protein
MTEEHDNDEVIELDEPGDAGNEDDNKREDRGDELAPQAPGTTPDAPDNEGSETDAAPDGAAASPERGGKPAGKPPMPEMVPQTRFHEVNEALKAERAEKQQLLELLARQAPAAAPAPAAPAQPEPFDVKAKEREFTAALLNGDDDLAVEIRMQINAELTRQANERAAQAEERAFERLSQREQQKVFVSEAEALRAEYPELDEKGERANIKAIEFVVRERDALISDGESPHNALRMAAEAAAVRYGFAKASPAGAAAVETASNVRQIQAATRNARAAQQQPAPLGGVGNRATQPARLDVEKMDEDEFDALPAAEKKRLRGD